MKKKVSLLLVLCILAAFASGCGISTSADVDTFSASADSVESVAVPPPDETISVSDEISSVEEPAPEYVYATYPLTDEPVTFSIWIAYNSPAVPDFNEQQAVLTTRGITGVTIDYKQFAPTVASEQFNLMVASGDYTDLIHGAVTQYNGGGTKAVEDDVLIDLLEIAQTYAPNFMEILRSNDSVYRDCINDDGYLLTFPVIYSQPFVGAGYAIREDWLKDLNLAIPETYDEWTDVLSAFKDAYGCSNPLMMTDALMGGSGQPTGGYDVVGYTLSSTLGSDMFQVDGTVHSSFLEDGYKAYIEQLHRWYEDGLISRNFTENSSDPMSGNVEGLITGGNVGIWFAAQTDFERYPMAATNQNFTMTAIPDPVMTKGQTNHFGGTRELVYQSKGYSVTTACSDPVLAVQWMDFYYSEEGARLANYGTEGISITMVDGEPQWTELLSESSNPGSVLATQTMGQNAGTLKKPTSQLGLYFDSQLHAEEVWTASGDGAYYIPSSVQLTAEEGDEFTQKASDYETHASQAILQFVIGDRSLDDWDVFVDEMKDMGIEDTVELYQAAVDRYYAR